MKQFEEVDRRLWRSTRSRTASGREVLERLTRSEGGGKQSTATRARLELEKESADEEAGRELPERLRAASLETKACSRRRRKRAARELESREGEPRARQELARRCATCRPP